MATTSEVLTRTEQRIHAATNEQQRAALTRILDPAYGYSYSFSKNGMHVIQRGRNYTITPFGAIHHQGERS